MTDLNMDVFVKTPGERNLSKDSLKLYRRHKGQGDEVAHFKMNGTTFSGHPTLTTLGNTLRSIMYCRFAAFKAGVWARSMAAGDDCIVYLKEADVYTFVSAYRANVSTHDKTIQQHGLGQVVKEFYERSWWNIEFCSKFSVHAGDVDTFDGYYLLRDPVKVVETKQYYTGTNPVLQRSAAAHVEAMSLSLDAELPIRCLQDLYWIRKDMYGSTTIDFQAYKETSWKHLWEAKFP